jgi:hypothetical protein
MPALADNKSSHDAERLRVNAIAMSSQTCVMKADRRIAVERALPQQVTFGYPAP